MALQTNLNKKDKMTIAVVLFIALVFAICWFLIKPAISATMNIEDKIEQGKITQKEYQDKILYLTSSEALYSKAVNDLNESTVDYYEIMDSSEIDRMVTSYVLKSGLFAESLIIKMPADTVDEKPYLYAPKTKQTTSSSSTSGSGNGADGLLAPYSNARARSNSTKSSGIKCAALTLVVTGTRKECQDLIDDICTKPAVRITSFNWEKVNKIEEIDPVTGLVTLKDPKTVRLRIDVNLYMADVADYASAVSDAVNDAVAGSEG